jgi:hypothetical protein
VREQRGQIALGHGDRTGRHAGKPPISAGA